MRAKHLFWILFLLNLLNYVDRQVLYAVFPLLKADLHLTDLQLGSLASAFMVIYMCYAPVMGFLADRFPRPRLIGISALIWSSATFACAAAWNYTSLLIARTFIGAGEGGFTTMAQPFLAEHYPVRKHAFILAVFGLALPIGSALGYVAGGLVGQHWGWQAAFMIVGAPGFLLALVAWLFLQDTARQTQTRGNRPTWKDYFLLLQNKPFLGICIAQAMSTFVMGGLSVWMPTYLHRYLAWNMAQAGSYFGILVIGCGAVGTLAGGKLASWWIGRSSNAYYQLIALSFLACLPCCWLTLWATHAGILIGSLSVALILLFIPTGAIAAALVATTALPIRSMAFAVNIFLIHLLGDAFSPTFVGWISDNWGLKTGVFLCSLALLPGTWVTLRLCSPAKSAQK